MTLVVSGNNSSAESPAGAEGFDEIDGGGEACAFQLNGGLLEAQGLSLRRGHVEISHESGLVTIVGDFQCLVCRND